MRKIKVFSTVGTSGVIESEVTTLGELKPLLRQKEIDFNGMKIVVGETRNELTSDLAELPTGDFKLYLMPEKTKSGSEAAKAYLAVLEALSDLGKAFIDLAVAQGVNLEETIIEELTAIRDMAEMSGTFNK